MTTLFVAAAGGHLTQLRRLATRMPPEGEAVWVTDANEQSRSLLADRDVEFVDEVAPRSILGVLRCLPAAHRLWHRRKLTRAVSTGSGIALGFLPYLAARGVQCHYIESAARVRSPSLTGRILQWVPGIRVYAQYPQTYGGRWVYGGSQFDTYEPVPAGRAPRERVRVVVTVGSTQDAFRRLLVSLVPLLTPNGLLHRATGLPVDVLWQTGATPVADLPIQARTYLPMSDLTEEIAHADIVVSHAGVGSALAVLDAGLMPVLVPRLREHGETSDDHQRQLASELSRRGLALYREVDAITVEDLLATLSTSVRTTAQPPPFALIP